MDLQNIYNLAGKVLDRHATYGGIVDSLAEQIRDLLDSIEPHERLEVYNRPDDDYEQFVYDRYTWKDQIGVHVTVKYLDDGTTFDTVIHFDHSEPTESAPYTDDEVFFYCNGLHDVKALMKEGVEEFVVTSINQILYER